MQRKIISVALAMIMILSLCPLMVFAAGSISARYQAGVVTVTGSGFETGEQYTVRVVNSAGNYIVTMSNAVINSDGSMNMPVTTGALSGDIGRDYWVYINGYDGSLTAKCRITTGTAEETGIVIVSNPAKTDYKVGEALDITGLAVNITYSNHSTLPLTITQDMISGFDSSVAGTKTITITYKTFTAAFTITVSSDNTQPGSGGNGGGNSGGNGRGDSGGNGGQTSVPPSSMPVDETEKIVDEAIKKDKDVIIPLKQNETSLDIKAEAVGQVAQNGESLIIKKDKVIVAIPAENLEAAIKGKAPSALLNISMTSETNTGRLAEITKITSDRSETVLSGTVVDITVTGGAEVKKYPQLAAVTIDLSALKLTKLEIDTLSGARFNADGSVNLLGGTYNEKDKTFTFHTYEMGCFSVVETQNLVTVELKVGSDDYSIKKQDKKSDVAPVIIEDRTMVPLRIIAEAFDAQVDWNGSTRSVNIAIDGKTISLKIGVLSPGMDVAPIIIKDRTMVPLRYIAEAFDSIVLWDEEIDQVTVYR